MKGKSRHPHMKEKQEKLLQVYPKRMAKGSFLIAKGKIRRKPGISGWKIKYGKQNYG